VAAGVLALKRAVLAWAGQEQAGSVQLLPFITANTQTWQRIQTGAHLAGVWAVRGLGSSKGVARCSATAKLAG
jgi:hypothetical protein